MRRQQGTPLSSAGKQKFNKLFELLRKNNVLARQNFSCCGGCGTQEMDNALKIAKSKIGFAFYHKQDGARLNEAQGTFVNFGDPIGDDGHTCVIGDLIVGCATDVGLFAKWSGSPRDRIFISEVE